MRYLLLLLLALSACASTPEQDRMWLDIARGMSAQPLVRQPITCTTIGTLTMCN